MAKRIQMRKNRFQKIAESMKAASENPGPPRVPGDHGDHAPKQTVSSVGQSAVVLSTLSFLLCRLCGLFCRRVNQETRPTTAGSPGQLDTLFFQLIDDRLSVGTTNADPGTIIHP